ncbi:MAG: DUF904 domain-containing protein [Rhodoferax sp.]|nr:DUF904 domain-containing protein [Rhodoferax sp.]
MADLSELEQLVERVERLLVRYAELQRTNLLLTEQVATLTRERDSLQSRLNAARARVDALLDRLPAPGHVLHSRVMHSQIINQPDKNTP